MAPKKVRDRKRQTKLDFSPALKSSPATRSSAATDIGKAPSKPDFAATKPTKRAPRKASKRKAVDSSSADELADETEKSMRSSMPNGGTQHHMFDGENMGAASDSSDGSDDIPHEKPGPTPRKSRQAKPPIKSEEEEEEEEEEEPQAKPKPSSRKRRRAATTSESELEEPTVTVIPRKRQRRTIEIEGEDEDEKREKRGKRRGARRRSTPEVDVVQVTPRNKRRKASKKAPTPDEEDDELSLPPPSSKRKSARRRSPSVEEVEEQTPPRSTRRILARRRPAPEDTSDEEDQGNNDDGANDEENDEEQDELKEDLAFLRSSPLPDRGRLRSTHDKPKNKRQEALEALKRRRAGTNEPSSSVTPGRKRAVVVETDSESELEVIKEEKDSDLEMLDDDDIEDDDEEEDRDANALDMFQEDHEDENFIDDNADDVIGEPSATADLDELRLLNYLSRAKPKELFKHAVEWMVMKKIHPAFDSTKNIYTVTFRKLDDEVKGLAGSKFTSSVWAGDFLRSIKARPELMINDISAMERAVTSPHCEACNRTGHTATSELILTGQPYDAETLEPLADPDDSDSDSALSADSEADLNGEKATFNAAGERLVPSTHRFCLGSTCKANAQVAHTLYHWRYHLYDWVKDYLKSEGHLTAEKLVKREGRSNRKREKEARKIVDAMEEKGQVRSLWTSYKTQVQFALDAQNEYKQGWGRR